MHLEKSLSLREDPAQSKINKFLKKRKKMMTIKVKLHVHFRGMRELRLERKERVEGRGVLAKFSLLT